jgi:hypothetical protein
MGKPQESSEIENGAPELAVVCDYNTRVRLTAFINTLKKVIDIETIVQQVRSDDVVERLAAAKVFRICFYELKI